MIHNQETRPGHSEPNQLRWSLILILGVTGFLLRVAFSRLGHNFDVHSYVKAADWILTGNNLYDYPGLPAFNYGPLWYLCMAFIEQCARTLGCASVATLHTAATCLLSGADFFVFYVLWTRTNPFAASLFYFAPVGILITGLHAQIDTLSIALGLAAWLIIQMNSPSPYSRPYWTSVLLFALSLAIKHDLIFFPLWLILQRNWGTFRSRGIYAISIYLTFLATVSLYMLWSDNFLKAFCQIFLYQPGNQNSLLSSVLNLGLALPQVPGLVQIIFCALMALFGGLVMQYRPNQSLYWYTLVLGAWSSGVADQYLAVPLISLAILSSSWIMWVYIVIASLVLIGSSDNGGMIPAIHLAYLTSRAAGWRHHHAQFWIALETSRLFLPAVANRFRTQSSLVPQQTESRSACAQRVE